MNAHVALVPFAAKSSNSATFPSILASTVPAVAAAILFTCVTWAPVIFSIAGVIVIFTSDCLVLIAVKSAWTVLTPVAMYVDKAPVNPVVNVIVDTEVASTIALPWVTVAASATVIVKAQVPFWLAFVDKSSNSAILPSIVAVTVPIVTSVTKFKCVIWLAVIVLIVDSPIFMSLSAVIIFDKLPWIAFTFMQFANVSDKPIVNTIFVTDVVSIIVLPSATVAASSTVIVNAPDDAVIVLSCATLPSIVAVTVPVVAAVIAFNAVTSFASILSIVSLNSIATASAPPLFKIVVKFVDAVSAVIKLPCASFTPVVNVTSPAVFPIISAPCCAVTASVTVIVIISVLAVDKPVDSCSNTLWFAVANVAVTAPAAAAIAFNSAIVGVSDIFGFADAATTFVAAVTNAAVISSIVPFIIISFDTVTVPELFPPILDNTVAFIAVSFASVTVNVILSVFAVDNPSKIAAAPDIAPTTVPEPAWTNSTNLLKSVIFAAVAFVIAFTVTCKFGSAVNVVVKFAFAVAAPVFIIFDKLSVTPAALKSIVVPLVFPTNDVTSSTFIVMDDTVIVNGSFESVVKLANCVLLPLIIAVTVPDVDAFTVFNAVTSPPAKLSVTVKVNAPEAAARLSKFANVDVNVDVTVPEPAFTSSTNLLKSAIFAAVASVMLLTTTAKLGSAVNVVVKSEVAVAAPAFIIFDKLSVTPAAVKSIVVLLVLPSNVATSATVIVPLATVITTKSELFVAKLANSVFVLDNSPFTWPVVAAATAFISVIVGFAPVIVTPTDANLPVAAVNPATFVPPGDMFAIVSEILHDNDGTSDVNAFKVLNSAMSTDAPVTVIVIASVEAVVKSSNCTSVPLIVPVTTPDVAAPIEFNFATFVPPISASDTTISTEPCFATVASKLSDVESSLSVKLLSESFTPVVKVTLANDVASTILLPCAAVIASATVIVNLQRADWLAFVDRSSNSAALPSIVTVTKPVVAEPVVVTSVTKFKCVTCDEDIVFIVDNAILISVSLFFIAVKFAWIALPSIQFANVSDIPAAEKSTVATDVASTTALPCPTVATSATVIVKAHVPFWLAFVDKSSNCAILPSIVTVIVPVVTSVTRFKWVIWLAVIVFTVPKLMLISPCLFFIAVKSPWIASLLIQFANVSDIPVVNATVDDVASTTALPCSTVTASATVIAKAHVAVWLAFVDKSSNCAILPSIVTVTVPIVTSVTRFKCVICCADIVFIVANAILILVSLFFIAVKFAWIALPSIQFANVSDIPVVNATVVIEVASTTALPCVTVTASATVIVKAHVPFWLAFVDKSSNCATLPSIVTVTVPVVISVTKFKCVIWVADIVFIVPKLMLISPCLFLIAVKSPWIAFVSIQFANVSDIPTVNATVDDDASATALPCATVIASATVIINLHKAVWLAFDDKSSNSAALPSIVAWTTPVVAELVVVMSVTRFKCVIWVAVIVFIVPKLIFISPSLFLIAVKSPWIAPVSIQFANVSVKPAAEKSTVPTDVASTTALPDVTVTTSSTVIVKAQVAVWLAFVDKSSNSAILPSIVTVTVPVVTSVTKFKCVIWLAVIVFIVPKLMLILSCLFLIAVKSLWIAFVSIQFAKVSDIPVVNVIAVADVASTTDFAAVILVASATVIDKAHVPFWLAFAAKSSNSAILPFIVDVTVPVVKFVIRFTCAIWPAVIVFIVPKLILILPCLFLIAVKSLWIAPVSIQFANVSDTPVVNVTEATDVASTTTLPVVTVTASATIIVSAHVPVWLVFAAKSSNCAILPSIVAVTVPVVTSVTKFKCVIWLAVIVFIVPKLMLILPCLFFTAVKSPWIAFVSIQFANVSVIPVVNVTDPNDVASTTAFAAVTDAASATIIVKAQVAVWPVFVDKSSNSAIFPSNDIVTVPFVTSVTKFKCATWFALIVLISDKTIFTSSCLVAIPDKSPCIAFALMQFPKASDIPVVNVTVDTDVASTTTLPVATVTTSATVIVKAQVAVWLTFVDKSSNSAILPSIVEVTVPVVTSVTKFKCVIWLAVIVFIVPKFMLISPCLFLIAVKSPWIAFVSIQFANVSVIPVVNVTDVIDVASTTTLPVVTVTASATVIVKAHVPFWLAFVDKSSNCAILPSIVAVTVPIVTSVTKFKCVIWLAVIVLIVPKLMLISVSLFLTAVKLAWIALVSIQFANVSVIPAAEKSTVPNDVASTTTFPCVTVAVSSTTIVNAHDALVPVASKSSNSAMLPSIFASTVPIVASATLFTCATWFADIFSNAGVITIFTFVSLFLIAVKLAWTPLPDAAIYVARAPVNPAVEKSTVATDVASTIALPWVTVAASSTTIVYVQVADWLVFAVKSSNSAELPSIVACTIPVVVSPIAFICVILSALAFAIVSDTTIFTSASLVTICVKLAWTALPFNIFANSSFTPVAEKSTVALIVAFAMVLPCSTVTTSLTIIVKSSVVLGLVKLTNCAWLPVILASTLPVVDAVIALTFATSALPNVPFIVINTSGSCVTIVVVPTVTLPPLAKFAKSSVIPPANTTAPVVAFAIVVACATLAASVMVIATSGSWVVIAVNDAVAVPFASANFATTSDIPPASTTSLVVFVFITSNWATFATLSTVTTQSGSSVFKFVNAVVAFPVASE